MDISVNKVVKSFQFSEWYSDELTELFINDEETIVDLSTARMKYIGGKWIVEMFEYLQDNPQIIVHGVRHAGVFNALGILDDDELPDYINDEDSDLDEDSVDEDSDEDILDTVGSSLTISAVYTASESDSYHGDTSGYLILISDSEDED